MPANLTPQYYEAEEAFKNARTVAEKIQSLENMLAVMPKHKGTEKLQGDIKRRLSRLRQEAAVRSASTREDPFYVIKEGAGQIALLGCPNSGKSALVGALSRARVKIADYPFATTVPIAGMMPFENVLVQLVDTPPWAENMEPSGLAGLLHNADGRLLLIDAGDCLEQIEKIMNWYIAKRLPLAKTMIALSRFDREPEPELAELVQQCLPLRMEIIPISTTTGLNLERLRRRLFDLLEVIRIYTKTPGQQPNRTDPFVLPAGSTVYDLAYRIHKDLAQRLKNARVWGSTRFPGQSVPRDYVLHDQDTIELAQLGKEKTQ